MDSSSSDDSSSESSTAIPAASAGIVMLSLPDSFDEGGAISNDGDDKSSADQDVFETPPEYALAASSQDKTPLLDLDQIVADDDDRDYEAVIVAVGGCGEDGDGDGAVDLGMDADLVIPEGMEFRVSKRDLSLERSSAESSPPSKKLRSSDDDSEKSEEELETEQLSLSNPGSDSDHTLEIAGNDVKSVEESSREIEIADNDVKSVEGRSGEKKKVEYSGSESENGTQPVTEESVSSSGEECSFQADGEVDSRDEQVLRVQPLSFCTPADSSVMRAEEGREWSSLLEMVKLVKEIAGGEYNEVEKCSFLEIAKRRGMTFPRL